MASETEAGRHPDPLVQAWRDWQDRRDPRWDSYESIREAFAGGWDAGRATERVEALEEAIRTVLADAESQHPGGWGPDVTTVRFLREALAPRRAK